MAESGLEQLRENWTRFPNQILDRIADFSGSELKVLAVYVRNAIGWNRAKTQLAISFVAKRTGMGRTAASAALRSLKKRGYLTDHGKQFYALNWSKFKSDAHNSESPQEMERGDGFFARAKSILRGVGKRHPTAKVSESDTPRVGKRHPPVSESDTIKRKDLKEIKNKERQPHGLTVEHLKASERRMARR